MTRGGMLNAAAILGAGLILGTIAFVCTLRTDSTLLAYVHYSGLLLLLVSIAVLAGARIGRRWTWWIIAPVVVALMLGCWYFDYSYSEWSNVSDDGVTMTHRDWKRRGHAWPYYRRSTGTDWLGEQFQISRFTRYGKRHGMQTHNIKNPKHPAELLARGYAEAELRFYKQEWFWYDEEVSEGEWYLRNK